MFVVAGASGKTGAVVARTLLAQGRPVRVLLRDPAAADGWRQRGAEVAITSLADRPALERALQGATALYTLLPEEIAVPDFHGHRRRMAESIAGAVEAQGTPAVVLLSATAAVLPDGNGPAQPLHHAEGLLRSTGTRLIAIRAAFFQENVLAALAPAREQGVYPSFFPSADFALPTVASSDAGRLAARLLVEPPAASTVVDLLGPSYSVRQLAEALGRALGKTLQVVEVPAAAQVQALTGAGLPRPVAESIVEMFACLASGRIVLRGDRTERATTGIDETLRERLGA